MKRKNRNKSAFVGAPPPRRPNRKVDKWGYVREPASRGSSKTPLRRSDGTRVGGVIRNAVTGALGVAGSAAGSYARRRITKYISEKDAKKLSPSKTMKRKKRLNKNIMPEPSGAATRSYFKKTYKKNNAYKAAVKGSMPLRYTSLNSTTLSIGMGTQSIYSASCGDISSWEEIFLIANNNTGNIVNVDAQQLMYLKNMSLTQHIANAGLCTIYLKIYEIEPRNATDRTALDDWTLGDYQVSGGSSAGNNLVGATPFSSEAFVKNWVVNKIYNVELPQGASHIHNTFYDLNQIMYLKGAEVEPDHVRGRITFSLITAYGAPVHDSTDETKVSTGAGKLDIVTRRNFTGYITSKQIPYRRTYNGLDTLSVQEYVSQGGSEVTGVK